MLVCGDDLYTSNRPTSRGRLDGGGSGRCFGGSRLLLGLLLLAGEAVEDAALAAREGAALGLVLALAAGSAVELDALLGRDASGSYCGLCRIVSTGLETRERKPPTTDAR